MGYLFIALALMSNAAKAYCGKRQSQFVHGLRGAMTVNSLRMLWCVAVSVGLLAFTEGFGGLGLRPASVVITLLSGAANAGQVILWILVVQRSAFSLLDVFATLGVIVPMLICRICFAEIVRPIQWAGYALLCAAAIIMCSYSMSIKQKKMGVQDYLLLFGFGLTCGLTDLSQKLYLRFCPEISKSVFNFYTFLFAAAGMGLALLILGKDKKAPPVPLRKVWHYILIMATALFLVNYLKTSAAEILPAAQVYPLYQGGVLVLASLTAAIFFGEKITLRCVVGIAMTFVAMLMMNVL